MKKIIRYFVQGTLIIVPLAITVFVIAKIIGWIHSLFDRVGIIVNPVADPYIVLGSVILIIFLTGLLASTFLVKPLLLLFEGMIEKAPLVKIIYSSIKDFLSAFVGMEKRFNKPVLVKSSADGDTLQMGFVTQSALHELGLNEMVAVYLPISYAFSGRLIIVPKGNVTPINISASEAMKFIISGGVSKVG
jgi:uncharacterized membrane protein